MQYIKEFTLTLLGTSLFASVVWGFMLMVQGI